MLVIHWIFTRIQTKKCSGNQRSDLTINFGRNGRKGPCRSIRKDDEENGVSAVLMQCIKIQPKIHFLKSNKKRSIS